MFLQELRKRTIISLAMVFIIAGTAIAQRENPKALQEFYIPMFKKQTNS